MLQKRNPAVVIFLSILTCGIYSFYWIYQISENINTLSGERKIDSGLYVILSVLCFPIAYVWLYMVDEALFEINQRRQKPYTKNFILWIVLTLVGLGFLVGCIQVQNSVNLLIDDNEVA